MAIRRVQILRRKTGLRQPEFAALIGVAPSTIYRWEADGGAKIDPRSFQFLELLSMLSTKVLREIGTTCRTYGAWIAVRDVLMRAIPLRNVRK